MRCEVAELPDRYQLISRTDQLLSDSTLCIVRIPFLLMHAIRTKITPQQDSHARNVLQSDLRPGENPLVDRGIV
jgi:hypothetical protein